MLGEAAILSYGTLIVRVGRGRNTMNFGRALIFAAATLLVSACERQQPATPSGAAAPGPAESTGRQIGQEVDDAIIGTKVKAALLKAQDVKGREVKVETEKAVVQLSGFVSSQGEIERALEIARGVEGVRSVENKLSIKPR